MKKLFPLAALLAATLVIFPSCRKDRSPRLTTFFTARNIPSSGSENFQEVNVDIQQLQVKLEGQSNWIDIATNAGVYNLLSYRDGAMLKLTDNADLPKGKLDRVRVIIGSRNSVVYNGTVQQLPAPGVDDGSDVNLNTRFIPRREYELTLSIDVEKSITVNGNGTYSFSPAIKVERFRIR